MSDAVEQSVQEQQEPAFDSAKFIADRNKATERKAHETRGTKDASTDGPREMKASVPETKTTEEKTIPRHVRREMNRLREEAAEARGRLAAIEELRGKPEEVKAEAKAAEDPEPQRKDFANDADYNRALGRWDARQEAKKELTKREQTEAQKAETQAFMSHVQEMTEKAVEDKKLFPDWDKVSESLGDSDVEFSPDKHPQLMALLAGSDVRAYLYYHFGKNPAEFQKLLGLTEKPSDQIRVFHRLEGAVEKLYTSEGKKKDGAGPSTEKKGGDKDLADSGSPDGRNAAERDARKPKPSTEVGARGGSAPPEKPEIGSAAWMEQRNRAAQRS